MTTPTPRRSPVLEAIKAAGSTDSQKIMEALRTNMVDTPLGKIKFDAKGDAEGIGFSIYEVKDGKFVELSNDTSFPFSGMTPMFTLHLP